MISMLNPTRFEKVFAALRHNLKQTVRLVVVAVALFVLLTGCVASPLQAPTSVPPEKTPVRASQPTAMQTPTAVPLAQSWTPGHLEIHVLDVKHGDAQLIVSPTGETMLIDGAREEYAPKIAQYLRDVLGEAAVDYLLLSHYHVDHIQGIVPLFRDEGLVVRKAVLDRGGDRQEYDSGHYRGYYDYITDSAHGLRRVRVHPGDAIDMGPQITLDVLAVGDIDTRTNVGVPVHQDDNDNCIALWLTFGKFDYWTAGDLSGMESIRYADIESAVIPLLPREVDVYRADHHGIDYNSNPEFLAALNPTTTLVSTSNEVVGWETILRLEEYGDVYITDKIPAHKAFGDIVLKSQDGSSYTVEGNQYQSK
jgi:competence protein ComEC